MSSLKCLVSVEIQLAKSWCFCFAVWVATINPGVAELADHGFMQANSTQPDEAVVLQSFRSTVGLKAKKDVYYRVDV